MADIATVRRQRWILVALSHGYEDFDYMSFSGIARHLDNPMDVKVIRRTVRMLARRGFAEYGRGLWTEDGFPAGSGYRITLAGLAALADAEKRGE